MTDTDLGVTAPKGFRAAGITAGIKESGRPDLALVVNDGPSETAAAVFTRNKVQAAPVLWSRQVLADGRVKAVLLNSGGANACTGPEGFQDTHASAEKVAESLGLGAIDVAVCSTGLIGERLPMRALLSGVDTAVAELSGSKESGLAAATAVLTTDKVVKQAHAEHPAGWSAGGFAKGAGMLAPSMATMLCVLTTDAEVDPATADAALREAVRTTFDRLDVDGSTSTNDTVLLMASGASGQPATETELAGVLTAVCASLVRQLQADAEGVTKRIAVTVRQALTEQDAVLAARTVARDSLVKTALFGSDPNWGRIAAAVGYSGAEVDPNTLDVIINDVLLCKAGARAGDRADADLSGVDIRVTVNLGLGDASATILTTDLSHAYVEENSAYSS